MSAHNPSNRQRSFNGSTESKRSRQYRKVHPINKRPRRKPLTHFARPLWFDSSCIMHRMFIIAYDLVDKIVVGDHSNPLCTDVFLYEAHMTPEIMEQYKRL